MPAAPRRLHLDLTGGLPLYQPAHLRAVLERLVQDAALRPATWGLDEKGGKPVDLDAMAQVADGTPTTRVLRMKRTQAPAAEMFVPVGAQPQVAVHVASRDVAREGPRCVALADALAEVFQPDVGWVHASFDLDPPLTDERSRAWWIMDQVVGEGGGLRGYGRTGPGGLAMVTYLGPRWVAPLGELLRAVPGVRCDALGWGGLRVSLCDAVFETPDDRLADQWTRAMASAAAAGVFAACAVRPDGATSFTRAPGFTWPATYRP